MAADDQADAELERRMAEICELLPGASTKAIGQACRRLTAASAVAGQTRISSQRGGTAAPVFEATAAGRGSPMPPAEEDGSPKSDKASHKMDLDESSTLLTGGGAARTRKPEGRGVAVAGMPLEHLLKAAVGLSWAIAAIALYAAFGGAIFYWLEPSLRDKSFLDAFYFAEVTMFGVGYGDISPSTDLTKVTLFDGVRAESGEYTPPDYSTQ